jgi:type II secretory pathway predicted ATPase ExeA
VYEKFYKLQCKPFALTPDPRFIYLSDQHAQGLATLEYAILNDAGITLLTGEVGAGKTMLTRRLLEGLDDSCEIGVLTNTQREFRDILPWVLRAFHQPVNPGEDSVGTYERLIAFLEKTFEQGRRVLLMIDEGQNLDEQALEELRLLSNLNVGSNMQLQLILVGQPELLKMLKQPRLRSLAQRIAVEHQIAPLSFDETREYISHRLKVAGCPFPIFDSLAFAAIFYHSRGIPRLINTICDLALAFGYGQGRRVIGPGIIGDVVHSKNLSLHHLEEIPRPEEADRIHNELRESAGYDICLFEELQPANGTPARERSA